MSKPVDIPQDVWAIAEEVGPHPAYASMDEIHERIARAIIAAEKRGKIREREACAERYRYAPGSDPRYEPYIRGRS